MEQEPIMYCVSLILVDILNFEKSVMVLDYVMADNEEQAYRTAQQQAKIQLIKLVGEDEARYTAILADQCALSREVDHAFNILRQECIKGRV